MKKIPVILLLSIILFGCNENFPDCGDPVSMNCELVIVDSLNNNLIGTKYNQDSIRLSVNNALIPLNFSNGTIIFNFTGFDSFNDLNYILKLNSDDSDTLNIKIRKYTNQCWSGYAIDTMHYNNQVLHTSSANSYRLIK